MENRATLAHNLHEISFCEVIQRKICTNDSLFCAPSTPPFRHAMLEPRYLYSGQRGPQCSEGVVRSEAVHYRVPRALVTAHARLETHRDTWTAASASLNDRDTVAANFGHTDARYSNSLVTEINWDETPTTLWCIAAHGYQMNCLP